jgi:hypothetical protein
MTPITHTEQRREISMPREFTSTLLGAKLDVSNQDWLPCPNLDEASPEQVRAIEDELSAQLPEDDTRVAYVGRNRFEVLPLREAQLLSMDRVVRAELTDL